MRCLFIILFFNFNVSTTFANTVYYNFNGKTACGTERIRPHASSPPYTGNYYVPNELEGEYGPRLENIGPGVAENRYRSYYSNNEVSESEGRETLKLKVNHPHSQDGYRTLSEEGNLPTSGSFTWEMTVKVGTGTLGPTSGGHSNVCVLVDNQGFENVEGVPKKRGAYLRVENTNIGNSGLFDLRFGVVHNSYGHMSFAVVTGLNLDEYYHFAAVYDDVSGKASLYVNGIIESEVDVVMYPSGRSSNFGLLGCPNVDALMFFLNSAFEGHLDELAFSDTALGPDSFVLNLGSVVAYYNFNGRSLFGTSTKRPLDSLGSLYDGEDYIPNPLEGEYGPRLKNVGPGVSEKRYRSYYSNNETGESEGRETLKLKVNHPHSQDGYHTVAGEGNLPTYGSFTWEMVVKVDMGTLGPTTGGHSDVCVIVDNQSFENVEGAPKNRGAYLRVENTNADGSGLFDLRFGVVHNSYGHVSSAVVTSLNLDEYYHFAAVYNDVSGKASLYVNGVLKSEVDVVMYPGGRSSDFGLLGCPNTGAVMFSMNSAFEGHLDELAFSNTALGVDSFMLNSGGVVNVQTDLVELGIYSSNMAGDGVTDDSDALKALANWSQLRPATVIYFPAGIYIINSTVKFTQKKDCDLVFYGDGPENTIFTGSASTLLEFQSVTSASSSISGFASAFEDTFVVDDASGFLVGNEVAIHSIRSSHELFEIQDDNSGGVEFLRIINDIDYISGEITLSEALPWHTGASNNIYEEVRRYDYYSLYLLGLAVDLPSHQNAVRFSNLKDIHLENLRIRYTGSKRSPTGNGLLFNNVHDLYAENVDCEGIQYGLWQVSGCTNHFYTGCDGYRTRHTFVWNDSSGTIAEDSHGFECVSHLDTHRGVNHLTVRNCDSYSDKSAFRCIAGVSLIENCSFVGFNQGGIVYGDFSDRAQGQTYVIDLIGTNLDKLSIGSVLELNGDSSFSLLVSSIYNQTTTSASIIGFQGRKYTVQGSSSHDLGSKWSGTQFSFKESTDLSISGIIDYYEYIQVEFGQNKMSNCYFDASESNQDINNSKTENPAAITIGSRWDAEIFNVIIDNPVTGVAVGGSSLFYNDTTTLQGLVIRKPRNSGIYLANNYGANLSGIYIIGDNRTAHGVTSQNGSMTDYQIFDCHFENLDVGLLWKGNLDFINSKVTNCNKVLSLLGSGNVFLNNVTMSASAVQIDDTSFSGTLTQVP